MKWKRQWKFSGEQVLSREDSQCHWCVAVVIQAMRQTAKEIRPCRFSWTIKHSVTVNVCDNHASLHVRQWSGASSPLSGQCCVIDGGMDTEPETFIKHDSKGHCQHLHFPLNHGSTQFALASCCIFVLLPALCWHATFFVEEVISTKKKYTNMLVQSKNWVVSIKCSFFSSLDRRHDQKLLVV